MRSHDYQIYVYFRAMDDLGKRRGENLFKTTSLGRFLLNALIVYMEEPSIVSMDNERVMDGIPSYGDWVSDHTAPRVMTASEKYELHKEEYIKNLQAWMEND